MSETLPTSAQPELASEKICPNCGQKGKLVSGQTVKALLASSLRQLLDTDYSFCRTQDCKVVYYANFGESVFTTEQLRERVYQKEPNAGAVLVCYCFRHTVEDLQKATPEAFTSILKDIHTGIQANQCACDLRNPQGSCCLGNVRALMKPS